MQEMSVFWLRAATAFYAVGLLQTLLTVLRGQVQLFRVALGAFCVAVVLHLVSLTELTQRIGSFPAHNFHETVSVCGVLIALFFLLMHARYRFESASVVVFPFVFLMTFIGSTELPVATWANRDVRDAWLLVHVGLVLVGYAALLLTAVASVFYLVQERALKSKRRGRYADRLPPLSVLDEMISRSMGWGFVCITLATVAGSVWAFTESGTRWIARPEVTISFVTWGFYLLMIFLRMTAGWRGRKAALMALAVLGCSALTWAAHVGLRSLITQ